MDYRVSFSLKTALTIIVDITRGCGEVLENRYGHLYGYAGAYNAGGTLNWLSSA